MGRSLWLTTLRAGGNLGVQAQASHGHASEGRSSAVLLRIGYEIGHEEDEQETFNSFEGGHRGGTLI